MNPGDTCTVLAGDYPERVTISPSQYPGTITYQAQGEVTMQGFNVNSNYITITGFTIIPDSNANDVDG